MNEGLSDTPVVWPLSLDPWSQTTGARPLGPDHWGAKPVRR
ncbi:MAG: hypothetical protein ACOYM4_09805 [Nodosilinea sp.]